jgi:hypothetical protein
MKKIVPILIAVALVFSPTLGWDRISHAGETPGDQHEKVTGYHCSMHPNFHSDKPGKCGICGMTLVPDKPKGSPTQGGMQHGDMQHGGMQHGGMQHGGMQGMEMP